MTEDKLYRMAYNWAVHVWYKLDLYIRNNPDDSKYCQEEAERLWQTIKEIEQIAKENGYNLQGALAPFFYSSAPANFKKC